MHPRSNKKGRNFVLVDKWLETLGYYRKNVAHDETCLFRCIAEQVYNSQIFHERVRKECIDYACSHCAEFEALFQNKHDWQERIQKMKTHMLVCGNVEIKLISSTYNRNVVVFDGMIRYVNFSELTDSSMLVCKMDQDHYDVIYKKEYIDKAGFCQSIVYETLYKDVFEIPNVPKIVKHMLYKEELFHEDLEDEDCDKKVAIYDDSIQQIPEMNCDKPVLPCDSIEYSSNCFYSPFPYKVAKALDPNIYRNIEYDSWIEFRREMRMGEWYLGGDKLILGTACTFTLNGQVLKCYIQEMDKNDNKCVVYVTSLAEKRVVNYDELRAEDGAKPWPLPYRFAKSLSINEDAEKNAKSGRKKKEKRLSLPLDGAGMANSTMVSPADSSNHVKAFVGCPLQMQDFLNESQMDSSESTINAQEGLPVETSPNWNHESWQPGSDNPAHWELSPVSPSYYLYKPPMTYTPPVKMQQFFPNGNSTASPIASSPIYLSPDQGISSGCVEDCSSIQPYSADASYSSINYPPNEKIVYANQNVPPAPEMYTPVYPSAPPPMTPMYYTPPTRDLYLNLSPSNVPVYGSPAEVQYVPSPYVYSPTTPAATWYPGVGAQGFIFPTTAPYQ